MLEISMVQNDGTLDQLKRVVKTAGENNCPCVYILDSFFEDAKREMQRGETRVPIGCGVGFPSGGESLDVKRFQLDRLLNLGCDEFDIVLNLGRFLSGDYSYVEKELKSMVKTVSGKPVKAIIEVMILSKTQIEDISKLCVECGADYVKTGTGWSKKPTTIEHIEIIKNAVGGQIKIKASGGIRSLSMVNKMSELGVSRFGVNFKSAVKILDKCKRPDENSE